MWKMQNFLSIVRYYSPCYGTTVQIPQAIASLNRKCERTHGYARDVSNESKSTIYGEIRSLVLSFALCVSRGWKIKWRWGRFPLLCLKLSLHILLLFIFVCTFERKRFFDVVQKKASYHAFIWWKFSVYSVVCNIRTALYCQAHCIVYIKKNLTVFTELFSFLFLLAFSAMGIN